MALKLLRRIWPLLGALGGTLALYWVLRDIELDRLLRVVSGPCYYPLLLLLVSPLSQTRNQLQSLTAIPTASRISSASLLAPVPSTQSYGATFPSSGEIASLASTHPSSTLTPALPIGGQSWSTE